MEESMKEPPIKQSNNQIKEEDQWMIQIQRIKEQILSENKKHIKK